MLTTTTTTRRGRPTVLTLEKRAMILGGFALGLPHVGVAHLAGVHQAALARWLARGRQEEENGVFRELAVLADAVRALHQPHNNTGDPEITTRERPSE